MRAAYGLEITCFWATHFQVFYCKCVSIWWNNVYECVDFINLSSWTLTEWAALSGTLLECHTITDQPLAWILSEFLSCCLVKQSKTELAGIIYSPLSLSEPSGVSGLSRRLQTGDRQHVKHKRSGTNTPSKSNTHTSEIKTHHINQTTIAAKQIHCQSKSKSLEDNTQRQMGVLRKPVWE